MNGRGLTAIDASSTNSRTMSSSLSVLLLHIFFSLEYFGIRSSDQTCRIDRLRIDCLGEVILTNFDDSLTSTFHRNRDYIPLIQRCLHGGDTPKLCRELFGRRSSIAILPCRVARRLDDAW